MNHELAPPKPAAPILASSKRKVIATIAVALLAAAGTIIAVVSSGQAHTATPHACKVAALAVKDMSSGAVDGQAMGTYASALAIAARQPSAVSGEAGAASVDALAAQQDVSNGDSAAYKTDADRFLADLEVLTSDCKAIAG